MNFLYFSCSAIIDSPGDELNSYKSKHLVTSWQMLCISN